jgi:hypothetical protein
MYLDTVKPGSGFRFSKVQMDLTRCEFIWMDVVRMRISICIRPKHMDWIPPGYPNICWTSPLSVSHDPTASRRLPLTSTAT